MDLKLNLQGSATLQPGSRLEFVNLEPGKGFRLCDLPEGTPCETCGMGAHGGCAGVLALGIAPSSVNFLIESYTEDPVLGLYPKKLWSPRRSLIA